jgi:hypothetical protein
MAGKQERDRTYWLTRASVARSKAEEYKDPLIRREIENLAKAYERIARLYVVRLVKKDYDAEGA